jgi:hypothetical protein
MESCSSGTHADKQKINYITSIYGILICVELNGFKCFSPVSCYMCSEFFNIYYIGSCYESFAVIT